VVVRGHWEELGFALCRFARAGWVVEDDGAVDALEHFGFAPRLKLVQ
jgi:hypothetical protein